MRYYSTSELNHLLHEPFRFEALDHYISITSDPGLTEFLRYLKLPGAEIFIGWIEQWRAVSEIIKEGETSVSFSDYLRLKEHTLFASFQQFVTPFLFPPLLKQAESGVLNETLEYIVLLEPDSGAVVENVIYTKIEQLFISVHHLQEQKKVTEDQLIEVVHDVVNEQITKVLNSFSRRSYVHVIAYVEYCFSMLKAKGCTLRMANWIVKQLQQLQLSPEHIQQLSDFQNDLKTGAVRVENKGKKQSGFRMQPLLTAIGLIVFTGIVILIIVFKPWSEHVSPQELETVSSFTEFTVEERKHIDSLLRIIQPEPLPQLLEGDFMHVEGRELMVDARKTFANKTADAFYDTWEDYLSKDTVQSIQSCKELFKQIKRFSLPEGFLKLTEKQNGKPAFFRNESEYTIQLVVFNNQPGSKAYYYELKKDEQVEFNLSVGEHIGIVTGRYTIPYKSGIESIVFCEFDNTTFSSLMTSYVLKPGNSYSYKFLVSGTDIFDFQVVDMYGVLEVYR